MPRWMVSTETRMGVASVACAFSSAIMSSDALPGWLTDT